MREDKQSRGGARRTQRSRAHRQTRAKAAGCKKMFADKKSEKDIEREQLAKCLDYMRAGDPTTGHSPSPTPATMS
ncbi:hypothetical protein ACWCPQ_01105 [Nocardia sp. NPDC001965]